MRNVAGKLVQRTSEVEGNKDTVVEIRVTHVGPDLQFATAQVAKSTAAGSKSSSDGPWLRPRPRKSRARKWFH